MPDNTSKASFKISQTASTLNLTVTNKVVPPENKVDLSTVNTEIKNISQAQKALIDGQNKLAESTNNNDVNKPNSENSEIKNVTAALTNLTPVLAQLVQTLQNQNSSGAAKGEESDKSQPIIKAFSTMDIRRNLTEVLNDWVVKKENVDKFTEGLKEILSNLDYSVSSTESTGGTTENITDEDRSKLASILDILNHVADYLNNGSGVPNDESLKNTIIQNLQGVSSNIQELIIPLLESKINSLNVNSPNETLNSINNLLKDIYGVISNNVKASSGKAQNAEAAATAEAAKPPAEAVDLAASVNKSIGKADVENVLNIIKESTDFIQSVSRTAFEAIDLTKIASLFNVAKSIVGGGEKEEENPAESGEKEEASKEEEKPAESGEKEEASKEEKSAEEKTGAENTPPKITPDNKSGEEQPKINATKNQTIPNPLESPTGGPTNLQPTAKSEEASAKPITPPTANPGGEGVGDKSQTEPKAQTPAPQRSPLMNQILAQVSAINENVATILSTISIDVVEPIKAQTIGNEEQPASEQPTTEQPLVQPTEQEPVVVVEPATNESTEEAKVPPTPPIQPLQPIPSEQPIQPIQNETNPASPIENPKNAGQKQIIIPDGVNGSTQKPNVNIPEAKKTGGPGGGTGKPFESILHFLSEILKSINSLRLGFKEKHEADAKAASKKKQFGNVKSDKAETAATAAMAATGNPAAILSLFDKLNKDDEGIMGFLTGAKMKLFLFLAGLVAVIIAFIWTLVKFPGLREKLVNWMKNVGVKLWTIWTNFWTESTPKTRAIVITIASIMGLLIFGPWGLLVGAVLLIAGLWPKYKAYIIATVATLTAAALLIYFGPIGLLVGVGIAVVAAIVKFRKQIWDGIKSLGNFIFTALKALFTWPIDLLSAYFPGLGQKLKNGITGLFGNIPFVGKFIRKMFGSSEGGENESNNSAEVKAAAEEEGKRMEEEYKSSRARKKTEEPAPKPAPNPTPPPQPRPVPQQQPIRMTSASPITSYNSSTTTTNVRTVPQAAPARDTAARPTSAAGGMRGQMMSFGVEKLTEAIRSSVKPCTTLLSQIYEKMPGNFVQRQSVQIRSSSSLPPGFFARMQNFNPISQLNERTNSRLQTALTPIVLALNDLKMLLFDGISAIKEFFGISGPSTEYTMTTETIVSPAGSQTSVSRESMSYEKVVGIDDNLRPYEFKSTSEYESYVSRRNSTGERNDVYTSSYRSDFSRGSEDAESLKYESLEVENGSGPSTPGRVREEMSYESSTYFESDGYRRIESERSTSTINYSNLVEQRRSIENIQKESQNNEMQNKERDRNRAKADETEKMGMFPKVIAMGIARYFDNKELKIQGGGHASLASNGNDKIDVFG